jgi:hypothetical protein
VRPRPDDLIRQRETVEHLYEVYDGLEPPPATNGVDFWGLALYARDAM